MSYGGLGEHIENGITNHTDNGTTEIGRIFMPTFGYNYTGSRFVKCDIGTISPIAVVVRADHTKLFSKLWEAISRCQNLLVIVVCLAFIFGVLIYFTGK